MSLRYEQSGITTHLHVQCMQWRESFGEAPLITISNYMYTLYM